MSAWITEICHVYSIDVHLSNKKNIDLTKNWSSLARRED